MRLLFVFGFFVTYGAVLTATVNNPWPNFSGVIILWFMIYLITAPARRRREYWENRRALQEEYWRSSIRYQNRYRY
ncbi:hypothetical protein FO440_18335 [Mucilaginibacter corticis]|uniref:Uncharacterized protein n=1 Tax=Mucilaginibacter corticis TaxID=2597670 RepID=A0A556MIG2_9SPHI|nr:hypothetical protein [Mucilaginibacter corticis]TSJ39697.1 hypothetical protein FO440_18335 [Mucilaginibacter corticis]